MGRTVAIIGGFRQHYPEVLAAWLAFRDAGWTITSPLGSRIAQEGIPFVRFLTDEPAWDDPTVMNWAGSCKPTSRFTSAIIQLIFRSRCRPTTFWIRDSWSRERPPRIPLRSLLGGRIRTPSGSDGWSPGTRNGIDAVLDLPAAKRRQDWAVWMHRQVRRADFVLVVASPEYRRRSEGDARPDEGRGVQWEAALIREEYYSDRAAPSPALRT
jgi:hypothetical protein